MAKKMRVGNRGESRARVMDVQEAPETTTGERGTSESIGVETTATAATAPSAPALAGSTHEVNERGEKQGSHQIVTRFPAELAARLDRFLGSIRNERFGIRVSRADAVRI